jgi:hypothetical protein
MTYYAPFDQDVWYDTGEVADNRQAMEFNEEHKTKIESLNRAEAVAYILFLESELRRHQDDIRDIVQIIGHVKSKFGLWEDDQ